MTDTLLPENPSEKKRKRQRAARACELCRAKKYRCDEFYPCSQCKRQKVECVYDVADHVRQRMLLFNNTRPEDQLESSSRTSLTPSLEPQSHDVSNRTAATPLRSPASIQWTQINVRPVDTQNEHSKEPESQIDEGNDVEVTDVNPHTQNVEFHGKTSSLAFLAALQPQSPSGSRKEGAELANPRLSQPSLVSMLHNEQFSPEVLTSTQQDAVLLEAERYYFRQAQIFLDGYFQNIHFIHPILDRQVFMTRCEDLWFGKPERQSKSFVALYYSVMSLGALIKTWDEDKFDGLGRLEWSRKFFNLTRTALGGLVQMTGVESVQCLFFMAKISQNELNPSLAYLYLGWAVRSSFSAGFNRKQISSGRRADDRSDEIIKLWWGLYSLEIEVSFALGRPDSLGSDAYHNQMMPALDETEIAIITVMVHFARIVREVSVSIYLSEGTIREKTNIATQILAEMHDWLESIPNIIKPLISERPAVRKITKAPTWAKRQQLVLEMRFHNVKMVLFRPFLTVAAKCKPNIPDEVRTAMDKCVEAARSTIELMHDMYCHHAFFRTWWYNTTYILYAASIALCYGMQVAHTSERSDYLDLGRKTVEILDAMEESTVARNASNTIKQIIASVDEQVESEVLRTNGNTLDQEDQRVSEHNAQPFTHFADDSLLSFLDLDENLDFLGLTFPLNNSHFPIWSDMNNFS